ncbi:MAG TPA: NUDIX domain-containing protein [Streptosporangiaceae bacterium]|jgi:8-oxo-dGTP pyrophosphatase MutT (NUDIX family)
MLALVDDQDRTLLVRRHRVVPDRWGWEIPGGLVDEGEQPRDAGHFDSSFTMKTYVHASDEDLKQGRQALAKIHRIV